MRVFILGATGYIGDAVLRELLAGGHSIVALARSDASLQKLRDKNVDVVRGDLRYPDSWVHTVHNVDAIVHMAATFSSDMGEVDRRVVEALVNAARSNSRKTRFIYTGGCWLYGATGDEIADESYPFNPIPAFAWMPENAELLIKADCFETSVIHPAMVYSENGGTLSRFISSAQEQSRIEVWGSLQTRWPLVHRDDLARAYRLVLEGGSDGEHYNVASETGVKVGNIVEAIAKIHNVSAAPWIRTVADIVEEHGDWAVGPTLDQQMSSDKIKTQLKWYPAEKTVCKSIG